MLPYLPVLDHEQPTETRNHFREQVQRRPRPIARYVLRRRSPVSTTTIKDIWSTIIAPQLRRTTGEAATARSRLYGRIPTGVKSSFEWEIAMY
eukprot:7606054-Pyramimonas_sp.AAC.1